MFTTILIPTYKDINALELILNSLKIQTYNKFDVIVAEDDNSIEVKHFLKNYKATFKIKHICHEDIGNKKAIILNKALAIIKSEYIIFIDGDTIAYSTFIESHVLLSEKKSILCGRRVNLGDKLSKKLREHKINSYDIEKNYLKNYRHIKNDNSRHYEQGLRLKPNGVFYKIVNKFSKNLHILGSNFSCYRDDIFNINGFDEDLPYSTIRDDTDLEWRFIASGCKMKSCKYCANLFHLNHTRNNRVDESKISMKIIFENQKKNRYIATNGIFKY